MRRWQAATLGCVVAFVLLPGGTCAAHAALESSNPVDGGVLAAAPETIELQFSEEVLASASSLVLLQLGPGTATELVVSVGPDSRSLIGRLPALDRGEYVVRFTVRDPVDLHITKGSVSFGIGVAAPPSEAGEEVVASWPLAALRGITDCAVILATGAVMLLVVVSRRRDAVRSLAKPIAQVAVAAGSIIAVGWILQLGADVVALDGQVRWGSLLLSSDPGRRALVGAEIALGVWFGARPLHGIDRRSDASGRADEVGVTSLLAWVLFSITMLFVVAASLGGHAGIGGSLAVGFALRIAHFLALGLWLGVVAVTWWLRRRSDDTNLLWPVVSRLAAVGLALTGSTGMAMSGRVAATVTALLATTYGRMLVIKLGVLLLLAVVGAFAARRVARGGMPRSLTVEFGLFAVALIAAGVLVGSAPAVGARFEPEAASAPQVDTANLADLTVSVSVEPSRPGPNLVQVRVLDTRRPAPGVVSDVVLLVTGPDGAAVTRRGLPSSGLLEWSDVELAGPGNYDVSVTITRDPSPVPVFESTWDVAATPIPRAHTVLSRAQLAPIALVGAIVWLLVVLGGYWGVRKRVAMPLPRGS